MNDALKQIRFEKHASVQVLDSLANQYGFDLSNENAIKYQYDKVQFTILGFRPTSQLDTLVVTLKSTKFPHVHDQYSHVLKIDLYNSERLTTYIRTACFHLQCNEEEFKKAIYSLRERLERYRLDAIRDIEKETKPNEIDPKHEATAREILSSDGILESIETLLADAGIIAEHKNALRMFFILLSRNLDKPLHILLQGNKQIADMLTGTIADCIPSNQLSQQTSMSAGSLYYTRTKGFWKHRVLHLARMDKGFKGASTLSEFIENQYLKRFTTEKEYITNQLHSSNKVVEGSICLMAYSDEDHLNAKYFNDCFLMHLEETADNKAKMLEYLKKESAGLIDTNLQDEAKNVLRAIGTLIKPIKIIIPYANGIIGNYSIGEFNQLLTFVKSVALLNQFNVERKQDANEYYIEATKEHLAIALELFNELSIVKNDLLTPKQRNLLNLIGTFNIEGVFKISDVIRIAKLSQSAFYREFNVLKEYGFVVSAGGNKKRGLLYKVVEEVSQFPKKEASFPESKENFGKLQTHIRQAM